MISRQIPVIDLFAGPGGLAEGFSAACDQFGKARFQIALSIEKDAHAHRTLELRAFFRSFEGRIPDAYTDYLQGQIDREELFSRFPDNAKQAGHEAMCLTLGSANHKEVARRVAEEIRGHENWILIGGPPCQAYSIMGRSRMKSSDPVAFARDERHFLYKEYLRILQEHEPPIFLMENVKGLLSAKIGKQSMFGKILSDLSRPNDGALRYRIVPLSLGTMAFDTDPQDFVLQAENFGIPQARHRVILCGVREDVRGEPASLLDEPQISLQDALFGLPSIRSRISRAEDSMTSWHRCLSQAAKLMRSSVEDDFLDVSQEMAKAAKLARDIHSSGTRFTPLRNSASSFAPVVRRFREWISRDPIAGVTGHESRAHMESDLYRYLFASAFSVARDESPRLRDFPELLLPKHRNVKGKEGGHFFADRFRVQLWNRPATTVTSHISKDGHYFIHPDPAQCRSLTVREAARLQTFPDNYHFEGNRTQQYHQIGNAVPPLLAYKIADSLLKLLSKRPTKTPKLTSQTDEYSVRDLAPACGACGEE